MKRPSCTTAFFLPFLLFLTLSSAALAYPLYGDLWELRQPRGDMVQVRIYGDEFYQVVESLDGYTLMRDPQTGIIVYANVTPDGTNLVSTGVEVGKQSPIALGLQQHVRITKESRFFKVKQARKTAQMTMPGEMPISATPPPSTGNVLGLVLLVDFDDNTAIVATSEVNNFANQNGYSNNGNNGSIWNYFNDVSDGALNYTSFVMTSYHRASNDWTYYDDCTVPWLQRARELIVEVLTQLESDGHDFSVYDSNSDGYIDAINLFYAGSTTCGWTMGMWPGSSGMQDMWSADGVATNRFQITGMGNSGNLTIGTFVHENGHMIGGFPDLYDYDGDSAGVGRWCVMASQYSTNPQEPCGYLKTTAGWASATTINSAQTVNVGPSSDNTELYKFPSGAPNEYFLIENRRPSARDANLPTSGLMITHIDENGDHNANQMTPANHFLVTVVQADGNWDLENNNNSGDSGDLYRSPSYPALTPCTDPDTDWWDGSASDYSFTTTDPSQDNMEVVFTTTDEEPVAVCQPFGHDGDGNCCIGVGVDNIDGGSYDPNGNGDIVSRKITAVDGNPVTPANVVEVCGDDGMHTVTLTVIDACGNESSCDADVEVINSPPVAICQDHAADADPIDCCITVHRNDVDGGFFDPDGEDDIASFGISAVDGNPVTLTNSVEICGNGTHTVELTMTDDCGKSSSCTADVEVIDVTPPTIDVSLNRYVLWPPNHKYMDIVATVEVEDNCDANPDWWLDYAMSDEPDNGPADGNTIEDVSMADIGTPDTAFKLRSERQGNGDGRKYTIIYCAEDDSGNQACDTVCVIVPHDQGHPAMAANGYAAGGTALEAGTEVFTVVIPSTQMVTASELDPAKAQIGNSIGVISALQSHLVDVTNDGVVDLALTFSAAQANQLAYEGWDNPEEDGLGKAATIGYQALYFVTEDEEVWEVADIYALGEPVTIQADRGLPGDEDKPIWDKEDQPLEPVSSAHFENGISSIYPNPFNPATTIRYSVAEPSKVQIAIFNVKGALVRLLVDRSQAAGEYDAPWDGTDSSGRVVATGVYFTRLVIGDFQQTRKMVLLK